MKISVLEDSKIGAVYTPPYWANWLIDQGKVYEKWLSGFRICDPTGGEGVFIIELIKRAIKNGLPMSKELLGRLGYIEIDPHACKAFLDAANQAVGVMSQYIKFYNADVLIELIEEKFDILIGNPPWVNFCDLSSDYKEILKEKFISEGLVSDTRSVLFGSSRIDLAALVINVAMGRLLSPSGNAYFYLPSSLYYGDNAHKGWRSFKANGRCFATKWIYEFSKTRIFDRVGTSYCAAAFEIDNLQKFPVRCFKEENESLNWKETELRPLKDSSDQWVENNSSFDPSSIKVRILKNQIPRQGVNTCGANDIFIFNERPTYLPTEYLFPLVTKEIFKAKDTHPVKWILIPYEKKTARPLPWLRIENHPSLAEYLLRHKSKLIGRKGKIIRSSIEKGFWWSLLGVGQYSFAPYKIIWQSYGKKHFLPLLMTPYKDMTWQGNQAMNAFIPCWNMSDAERILIELSNPMIEKAFCMLNGEGKCNWAQPGKVKKILFINEPIEIQQCLF
ncbi:class I SAM-dependent methyltransferase [Myxococcota bacterium]|nr:class I SAM-dependent methyltransferase [Myxococcota bacterium]